MTRQFKASFGQWVAPCACVAAVVLAAGCTGVISGQGKSKQDVSHSGSGSGTDPNDPELIADDGTYQPFRGANTAYSKTRIWQLTPGQYQTTVERAFGALVDLGAIQPSGKQENFMNQADGLEVGETYYADLEEAVQTLVVDHSPELEGKLGCSVDALDHTCLSTFLQDFGGHVLRSSDKNYDGYLALYDTLLMKLPARDAFQGVVAALLLSPKALFRTELGDQTSAATGAVSLTPGEIAENLAFSLWNAPPDSELLAAAQSGLLSTPDGVRAQVERMLASPDGQAGTVEFVMQWLGLGTFMTLEKNHDLFPSFGPALQASMLSETKGFIQRITSAPDASFTSLLTSNDAQVDASLAGIYGLSVTSPTPVPMTLPSDQRRGIWTQPAVVASMSEPTHTGVIYRGKFMLKKLLCTELQPPDGIVVPKEVKDALASDATTRERLLSIETRDGCKTCHTVLHPMALAMERYDTIGQYRDTENGKPIDASGSLFYTEFTQQPFQDAVQMLDILAGSEEVYQCFVRQAFRYLSGRREDVGDDPTLRAAFDTFRGGHNMTTLITDIVESDAFRMRQRN